VKRIPPQVSLRGVRLSQGLTGAQMAELIAERTGEPVSPKTIFNAENGEQGIGNRLLVAWAEALKLNPRDVRQDSGMRELIAEVDGNAAA